ncbi:MAG: hypothetical protein K8R45_08650 [Desulfobacterales bacterium]|nr:hypothetical protein [Desulfobacterales bacterium]
MEFRSKRNKFAGLMVIFVIAFLVLQLSAFSITKTYDIPSAYYVSDIIPFEENRNMVCSSYSSVGKDYELQLIRLVGGVYEYENLEKEINGNTISSFIFNTGEEGHILLRISSDAGDLSIKVKFTHVIPHLIFSGGFWIFGILFVITFILDKKYSEKMEYTMKADKFGEPKY